MNWRERMDVHVDKDAIDEKALENRSRSSSAHDRGRNGRRPSGSRRQRPRGPA